MNNVVITFGIEHPLMHDVCSTTLIGINDVVTGEFYSAAITCYMN